MWQYRVSPESSGYYIQDGDVQRRERAKKELLESSEAIRQEPNNATLYLNRSRVHSSLRAYDQAVQDLSEAVRLEPQRTCFFLYLRHLQHLYNGNPEKALDEIKEAVRVQPVDYNYFKCLAYVHQKLGQTDLAIQAWDDGIRRYPSAPEHYSNRAAFFEGIGLFREALEDCSEAVKLQAEVLLRRRPWERKNKAFYLYHAYHDRVSIYVKLGRFEEALADCNKCIEAEPAEWGHYRIRSEVYEAMGQTEAARHDYDTSPRLNTSLHH